MLQNTLDIMQTKGHCVVATVATTGSASYRHIRNCDLICCSLGNVYLRPKIASSFRSPITPIDRPTDRLVIAFGSDWTGSKFKHDSAVILPKPYESSKWALIRTRRGEIEYGEQYLHGFTKTTSTRTSITRPKPYESNKRALIRTRRGEIDPREQYSYGFAKSTFLTRGPFPS